MKWCWWWQFKNNDEWFANLNRLKQYESRGVNNIGTQLMDALNMGVVWNGMNNNNDNNGSSNSKRKLEDMDMETLLIQFGALNRNRNRNSMNNNNNRNSHNIGNSNNLNVINIIQTEFNGQLWPSDSNGSDEFGIGRWWNNKWCIFNFFYVGPNMQQQIVVAHYI